MAKPLILRTILSPPEPGVDALPIGQGVVHPSVMGDDELIGRSPDCAICLPDSRVSRRHARLVRVDDRWAILDLGSAAGTRVNGVRIASDPAPPTPIRAGDTIDIGPWRLLVDGETATSPLVTLTGDGTRATSLAPSRRLRVLSATIDALSGTTTESELAIAALRGALEGSGFRRGAILTPVEGGGVGAIATLERSRDGESSPTAAELRIPRSLIATALGGATAAVDAGEVPPDQASTIQSQGIHSAVCTPVIIDQRVAALIYLDSRAHEATISDGAPFAEDIGQLYALALACAHRQEMLHRQVQMQAELERARVLRDMLAPAELHRSGAYTVAHAMRAGALVSGDLFDIIEPSSETAADLRHPVILFGDASGHGVSAAMLVALSQAHLHSAISSGTAPLDALHRTNTFIATRQTGGAFLSLLCLGLGADGSVSLIDAGHNHWLIVRNDGSTESPPPPSGPPIGVIPEAAYLPIQLRLAPGDRLVLYTDGVSEVHNEEGAQHGAEGVRAALAGSASIQEDLDRIARLLDASGQTLIDDATVASIEFHGG